MINVKKKHIFCLLKKTAKLELGTNFREVYSGVSEKGHMLQTYDNKNILKIEILNLKYV